MLGSRYLNGITVVNWPIERILISYFGNQYARLVTGCRSPTPPAAFAASRRELLERIGFEKIRSDGYAFQIEMNYRLLQVRRPAQGDPFFFLDRERGRIQAEPPHRRGGAVDLSLDARRRCRIGRL